MQAQDGPGTLNETSTYVLGYAMGYVVPDHQTTASKCTEYTMSEAIAVNMVGIGSEIEHAGPHTNIGYVVGYRPVPDRGKVEVLIELEASDSQESIHAKNSLISTEYADLSLQHGFGSDLTGAVSKTAIEVSVCREGARPGSHITELFPSQNLLNCQTHEFLRLFANRYGYPAPPQLPNMTEEQMRVADVVDSPVLNQYVNKTLWPQVALRRRALLALSGYITASKPHKTNATMSTQTPAASQQQSLPSIDSTAAVIGTANAAAVPTPVETVAKTATVVTPAGVDNSSNSMAVDLSTAAPQSLPAKLDGPSMLVQIQRALEEKNDQVARLTAEKNEAQRNLASMAKKQHEIEMKNKIDSFINRCDKVWTADERAAKQAEMENYISASQLMPAEAADSYMKQRFDGLVKCAKTDEEKKKQAMIAQQQQAAASAQHSNDFSTPEEQLMLRTLWGSVMASKNNGAVVLPPTAMTAVRNPFQSTTSSVDQALADAEYDAEQSVDVGQQSKKPATVIDVQSGKVAAAAPSKGGASYAADAVPSTIREAYIMSHEMQKGMDHVTNPSLTELKKGGYMSGVVRKSAATGGKFMSTQCRYQDEQAGAVGLSQWNQQQCKDWLASISRGVLIVKGEPVRALGYSQAKHDELAQNAAQGEAFCSRTATAL